MLSRLQGSYLRAEAAPTSDIDIMALAGDLSPADLDACREIIQDLPEPEKSCRVLCSPEEMRAWNALEACQLAHTTQDYYGRLADFPPAWAMEHER